jgi:hypothetical protein
VFNLYSNCIFKRSFSSFSSEANKKVLITNSSLDEHANKEDLLNKPTIGELTSEEFYE